MNKVFALVDCNNFYVSCERLFKPELRNRPVVVLSNNDGCIVARSNEVKALGIPMGAPYFKHEALLKKHGVRVFSSNYSLYGDLSHRVMSVLRAAEPEVEIYSIDEAFISLPAGCGNDLTGQMRALKAKVEKHVGIPVSIGIGPTKTLAKVANGIAKKDGRYRGVLEIADPEQADTLLSSLEVGEIWGIGRRSVKKLNRQGIYTALELKNADEARIRTELTVTGLRTVMELRGVPCITLEEASPAKKSIVSSRSFGKPVHSLGDLKEAIATHVAIAAEKLRWQRSAANSVHVFILTNRFKEDAPQYSGNIMVPLPQPSSHTSVMIRYALKGLESIYRPGYAYNKGGVMLTDLVANDHLQQNLFCSEKEDSALMTALDQVNARWGRNTLQSAAAGLHKTWGMKRALKSPAYTTSWHEIPLVSA